MKKDVEVVRDPESIKIGIEDTRSKILSLLQVNDMTISQLAKTLDKDQSTIYRHIKKLEDAGFVEKVGEKKEHHIPEKIFGRTAGLFLLSPSTIDTGQPSDMMVKWEKQHAENIIELLNTMGYKTEDSEELVDDLSDIFIDIKEKVIEPIEDSEDELGEISFPTLLRLELMMYILELNEDKEIKEKLDDLIEEFHKEE